MVKTAILIDDDQDDIDILMEALLEIDNSVVCIPFTYPEQAIFAVQSDLILKPDIIFIDINMPKMTGEECLKKIRNMSELADVPIAMLSTSMPLSVAEKLKELGANFTFGKPSKMDEYHHIVKNILQRPRTRVS